MRISRDPHRRPHPRPRAFTLTEMLVVIMIIAILSSMVLFALAGVQEQAREKRTRAQITRLNELIMERLQSYQTRRVPPPPNIPLDTLRNNPRAAAMQRLLGIRELMRMEMPDRVSDVIDDPAFLPNRPSLNRAYQRRATANWTNVNEGAECLYLIVSRIQVGNSNALEFLSESEIGDTDNDGMPEILDAWGGPIRLLRWPVGFRSPIQDGIPENGPDAFDVTRLFPYSFALYPLIVSAGPDRLFDIGFTDSEGVSYVLVDNNPYAGFGASQLFLGTVTDVNGDRVDNSLDNIHNHQLMAN